ncbi:TetR/AcrR family transcriptional regulator [Enterococcus sp.]|uniref:TetR/AcrR family transcriptional regulator n=1 Tax=Enterococcus sp. TaxID=35783 RepID=UPI00290DFE74|nr:TetR/AcrR family transcriptional regulator [Enterococcus sp.]MDU5333372.1 TetR/AcrR family transcriptional regulator [Enterococcus sp.]
MRVSKDPTVRKKEILDVAEKLFARKGFDQTSTGEIIAQAGIARGTLYYHFRSKEEIMDAIVERSTNQLFAAAKKVAADQTIPVYQRFVQTVLALRLDTSTDDTMMDYVHKPQNALMHQKIQTALVREITPVLTGIIKDGIHQGLFQTDFPYQSVEMVVVYATAAFDEQEIVPNNKEQKKVRVQSFFYLLERMLGVEEGILAKEMGGMFD